MPISAGLVRPPVVAVAVVVVTLIPTSDSLAQLSFRLLDGHRSTDEDPELSRAAVAVVLTPDPDSVLLIRRAERTGDPWSGHMALPGGRRELGESLLATSIRECCEEVGFSLSQEQLAGALPDVAPRTPRLPPLAIRPFVFVLPFRPSLHTNDEVASAHWVDLAELLRPGAHHPVQIELQGHSRQMPAYQIGAGIVWGLTERILTSLLTHLR
jgi:8-oxo-dGTP pyrophosphatase MutT (NUDIX family)